MKMSLFRILLILSILLLQACQSTPEKRENNRADAMKQPHPAGVLVDLYGIKLNDLKSDVEAMYEFRTCQENDYEKYIRCYTFLDTESVTGPSATDITMVTLTFRGEPWRVSDMAIPVHPDHLEQVTVKLRDFYGDAFKGESGYPRWVIDDVAITLEEKVARHDISRLVYEFRSSN